MALEDLPIDPAADVRVAEPRLNFADQLRKLKSVTALERAEQLARRGAKKMLLEVRGQILDESFQALMRVTTLARDVVNRGAIFTNAQSRLARGITGFEVNHFEFETGQRHAERAEGPGAGLAGQDRRA